MCKTESAHDLGPMAEPSFSRFQSKRVISAITLLYSINAMNNEQILGLTQPLGRLNLLIVVFKGKIYILF